MLDLEEQLRRYGEAVEHDLLTATVRPRAGGGRARRIAMMAAVVVVLAVGVVGVVAVLDRGTTAESDVSVVAPEVTPDLPALSPERPSIPELGSGRAGVFTTATNTVLLFADGIDGVTAIDPDRRLVGRRVIEGARAGDPPFPMTLSGDHLVVGWGEIYAAPLDGGASRKIADATIHLPAAEPGEVWIVSWDDGRMGVGATVISRVRVDGTVVFSTDTFDRSLPELVIGVPGGLLVNTPDGVAVWDAVTETTGPVLGPGPATAATSDGQNVAWCETTCDSFHTARLDRAGEPTAPSVRPGNQQIALSPDGNHLAVLRPGDSDTEPTVPGTTDAELILTSPKATEERVVASGLDPYGALQWSQDAQTLFYAENSYVQPTTRIGRYDLESRQWESHVLPIEDAGLAPVPLEPDQARSFFAEDLASASECPGARGTYPSGRAGVCTFAFFTPDGPDACVADGQRTADVPDVVGRRLNDAAIHLQLSGFKIVGTGTRPGDPTGPDAVVLAQAPSAGTTVPDGSCIGFRTEVP